MVRVLGWIDAIEFERRQIIYLFDFFGINFSLRVKSDYDDN